MSSPLPLGWRRLLLLYVAAALVALTVTPTLSHYVGLLLDLTKPKAVHLQAVAPGIPVGQVEATIRPAGSRNVTLDGRTVTLTISRVTFTTAMPGLKGLATLITRADVVSPGYAIVLLPGPLWAGVAMDYAYRLATQGLPVLVVHPPGYGSSLVGYRTVTEALRDTGPRGYLAQMYVLASAAVSVASNLTRGWVVAVGMGLGGSAALTIACSEHVRVLVLLDGGGCLACSVADGSVKLVKLGLRRTPGLDRLDPLGAVRGCRGEGRAAVVLGLLESWSFSPRSIAVTADALKAGGWRVAVAFLYNPGPQALASYVAAAVKSLDKPMLWPRNGCCRAVEAPLVLLPAGDSVAWRPTVAGLGFTGQRPASPVPLLYPVEAVVYDDSYWFAELSSTPRAYGVWDGVALSLAAIAVGYLALRGSEIRGRRLLAVGLALAAPPITYALPTVYWPNVGILYLASLASSWPVNMLVLFSTVSPLLVPLALSLTAGRKRAIAAVASYAALALAGFEAARLTALKVIGPGLPPLSEAIVIPLDAVPAVAALALYMWVVKPIVEVRRRPIRRRRRRPRI